MYENELKEEIYNIIRGKPYKTIIPKLAEALTEKIMNEVKSFTEAEKEKQCEDCNFIDPAEVGEPVPWSDLD